MILVGLATDIWSVNLITFEDDMKMNLKHSMTALLATITLLGQVNVSAEGVKQNDAAGKRSEMRQRELAFLAAPIKSQSDLQEFRASSYFKQSPFKKLSADGQRRFFDSLTFNETGLTSFDYKDMEAELTVSQAYQILSLFGSQSAVRTMSELRVVSALDREIMATVAPSIQMADHKGYACESHATCVQNESRICMTGC